MYFSLPFLLSARVTAAAVVEQGLADFASSGQLAGGDRDYITSPVSIAQMIWASLTLFAATSIDPAGMAVTTLLRLDATQRFAMVDIDRLTVEGFGTANPVASERPGVPEVHIHLPASHRSAGAIVNSNNGPPGVDFSAIIALAKCCLLHSVDQLAAGVIESSPPLQPTHIGASKPVPRININRRVRAWRRNSSTAHSKSSSGTKTPQEHRREIVVNTTNSENTIITISLSPVSAVFYSPL